MACGCQQNKQSATYQYIDAQGNTYTGTQLEMRAKQIRDQRAGTPGTLRRASI